jgi:acetylornithine deacetylase/succinyl-diaminopimelate desuccinylase-like protein
MTAPLEPLLHHLDADREAALERWRDFLRFPSIGTDPAHDADTRACAAWLARRLGAIGFRAEVRATAGQPAVVAHHPGTGGGGPRVLYYGHYDVQPPDPLALWESPPFEPTVVAGPRGPQMVARGAVDDKGQVMTWLEALAAWHVVYGGPPLPVTVLLEGEEESGSPSLEPFLEAHREQLATDLCVVSDTLMWDFETPAICTQLRGLVYVEVTLTGPARDLHSGLYGGAVPNPLNALVGILAQLHDEAGRIAIPGFYDEVREPDPATAASWAALPFDERAFLAGIGLTAGAGEAGRSVLERLWSRPTCDLNGLWGGYIREGSKTVIPSSAHAKLSCRLVPDHEPARVVEALRAFLAARTPPGCRIELVTHGVARPLRIPGDSAPVRAARRALARVFAKPPALIGMGGSVPAVEAIKRLLGIDSLLIGFGLEDDRVHAPNEKFELACFERGTRAHAALLSELVSM